MVAPKRGRGAKAAVAKPTPAEESEPVVAAAPAVAEEESNGEGVASAVTDAVKAEPAEEATEGDAPAETTEVEVKEEERLEPGKLLVEKLPSSLLFEYQEKLKEQFSKYGEVLSVKRGPIVVTELTTTPTLSAIVEFKSKDSLDQAVREDGALLAGGRISVAVQPSTVDTTVLVGVPFEASNEYVRLLFGECGEVAQVQEFSKTKYKILRVTYAAKESIEKALKLDRELRINGFLVTVTKYREDEEQRAAANDRKINNKRQHPAQQNRPPQTPPAPPGAPAARNNYRGRGGGGGGFPGAPVPFRGRGGRGGGFPGRGTYVRGGGGGGYRGARGAINSFMPRGGGFMGRGGYMMDGQRPIKRMRQE